MVCYYATNCELWPLSLMQVLCKQVAGILQVVLDLFGVLVVFFSFFWACF